ncbi:MAG TPA: TetR/AcrR family transcriptional regulator, partial [Pseudonocardiaceae bacterium]|nr:TetR/AcrR family transcriptional regulator [Pseudonocardiaceae bacterium]
ALISAAFVELAEKGYAASRLEDIAARAEVTTGAIYSIFGSKQNLVIAATECLSDELGTELAPLAEPGLPLDEVLRGIATTYHRAAVGVLARQRFAFELELTSLALRDPDLGRTLLDAVSGRTDELIVRLLTDRSITAQPRALRTTEEQARQLAPALLALMSGLVQRAVLDPQALDEDYCARAAVALAALAY